VPGEITVSGHTDNVATEDELFQSNWELSSQRAVAVAHQMIKVPGFDGNRLVVQGMADSQPLVPNNSPENRRMNRRRDRHHAGQTDGVGSAWRLGIQVTLAQSGIPLAGADMDFVAASY
jgi:hypothetical protein